MIIKTERILVLLLSLMPLAFMGCSENEQPVIDNPGQAIFARILPPLSVRAGEVAVLQVNAADSDGDELRYEWSAKNSDNEDVTNRVFVFGELPSQTGEDESQIDEFTQTSLLNQGPQVRFTTNNAGTYLVTVTIDDGNEHRVTESTFIEVTSVNRPPVLDATDAITISPGPPHRIAQDIFLTAQAADLDGDKLTYEWTVRDQNNQAAPDVIEANTGVSIKFTTDTPGSYLVSVAVTDGHDGRDRAAVVVVVTGQP
ncbi:MAG: PKD domain-containing protein [Candidatus Poribacteria bacterium]|nr:PKD domain-containing protein [Candidatus Poribacteria bacterium]